MNPNEATNMKTLRQAVLIIVCGAVLSASAFADAPSISSLSPTSGPIGTTVTINGNNFDPTPANNIVYFGAVRATVTFATSTELKVTVPTGAIYAPITVTTNGLTAYSAALFVVTFSSSHRIDSTSFSPKQDYGTGYSPFQVGMADVDGDGKADLIASNRYSNSLSVLRNIGTPGALGFASKVDFQVGNTPFHFAVGDLDGDGKLDLVASNYYGPSISVLRNLSTTGSIAFAERLDLATLLNPTNVTIADLDGDGRPDIGVSSVGTTVFSIFRNTSPPGALAFASREDFDVGAGTQHHLAGDIDGDLKPDLTVLKSSGKLQVLRNTSSAEALSFSLETEYATGATPLRMKLGDFDDDGKLDVVVTNYDGSSVSVFRNTSTSGSVSFDPRVDFTAEVAADGVAVGDLDGDGKLDFALTANPVNKILVYHNTPSGIGISSASFAAPVEFAVGSGPKLSTIGDLDGDGKPEIAEANYDANTVSVLRNTVAPETPENLTAIAGVGQIALKWNRISENRFLRYRIYAGTSPSPTTMIDSTAGGDLSDTSKTITGLTNGTTYYFRVDAVDSSEIKSEYSNEVSAAPCQPTILSAKDVPNDQGGRVTIRWRASALDDQIYNLPSYSIWRAIPEGLEPLAKKAVNMARNPQAVAPRLRLKTLNGVDYAWEWIATQPAHRFPTYSYTAETLYDSMSTTNGQHYFLVSAQTSDPFVYYDSNVDSGYSVDNLSPAAPSSLLAELLDGPSARLDVMKHTKSLRSVQAIASSGVKLTWEKNRTDPDVCNYVIYRSTTDGFLIDDSLRLATTTDTTYTDPSPPPAPAVYYRVTTCDIHENESSPSPQGEVLFLPTRAVTKVFLPGTYADGDSMRTSLRDAGLIPTAQPYSTAPWNYSGNEQVGSIPSGVVDWVLIQLRTDLTTTVATRAAFLMSDGSVTDIDGASAVRFDGLSAGDYYIVVRHRNHLGVMSASAVSLSSSSTLYNFTTAQTQAYGINPMADLGSGKYGMISGDTNGDGIVDASDRSAAWNDRLQTGYKNSDVNLDGIVDASDRSEIWNMRLLQTKVP
jgi:hypothetical protein